VISPTQRPLPNSTQHLQEIDIHTLGGIRTHIPNKRAAADPHLRPCGYWDRLKQYIVQCRSNALHGSVVQIPLSTCMYLVWKNILCSVFIIVHHGALLGWLCLSDVSTNIFHVQHPDVRVHLKLLACRDCGFESSREHGCLLWVVCVVRYKSLRRIDNSPRGVIPSVGCFECDREDSIKRRAWPIRSCCATEKESRYSHESTAALTSSKSVFCPHGVLRSVSCDCHS